MTIGGRGRIDFFSGGIRYHVKKCGIQIGLSLKIKDKIEDILAYLIKTAPEKIALQHAGRPCEGPQAAWAFRTT